MQDPRRGTARRAETTLVAASRRGEQARSEKRKKLSTAENAPQEVAVDADVLPVRTRSGSDDVIEAAEVLEREQQTLLEAATVEQAYQDTLVPYVLAKHAQAESLEDRLEHLIDQQSARLTQTRLAEPGVFTRPATKHAWQVEQAQQQARLQTLRVRLEAVREITEGMGLYAPRIEELATRKLRAGWPELAADWDAMREALRQRQLHERGQRVTQQTQKPQSASLVQSLSVSRPL